MITADAWLLRLDWYLLNWPRPPSSYHVRHCTLHFAWGNNSFTFLWNQAGGNYLKWYYFNAVDWLKGCESPLILIGCKKRLKSYVVKKSPDHDDFDNMHNMQNIKYKIQNTCMVQVQAVTKKGSDQPDQGVTWMEQISLPTLLILEYIIFK